MGRPRLRYLKQVVRNTGADSHRAMKRMACSICKWKAADQSKDCTLRRRPSDKYVITRLLRRSGTSSLGGLKLFIIQAIKIQLVPHREHSVLPLERVVAE